MPTHCPFCAAPLPPTGDAFCGECRGQLDEAPPPGSTPADLELRRKLSSATPGELTGVDVVICVLFPMIGLIVGAVRQSRDPVSGTRMAQVAGISLAVRVLLGFATMLIR